MTIDFAGVLRPGARVVAGQALGEPTVLLDQLFDAAQTVPGVRLLTGMSLSGVLLRAPASMELTSWVGLGSSAPLLQSGRMQLFPGHLSDLPGIVTTGPWRPDIALIQVGPPNGQGMCSLGVTSDFIWHALQAATVVLAEINEHVPQVAGDTMVEYDRLAGHISTSRELPEYPPTSPSDTERNIAARIAPFIPDGACIQLGIGRLAEAVFEAISSRRDLGVHSGMLGDSLMTLVRSGVITNARKGTDVGLTVGGAILGTRKCVQAVAEDPHVRLRSLAHVNSSSVIAQLPDFISVNSALQVDLLGQVNSEVANGRYVGTIGGQVDFVRSAARSPGGRSIIALPATARGGSMSRIVDRVEQVTVLRSDVDVVVTEYGVAELRGVTEGERARRIISLAAPDHRHDLMRSAKALGL